MKISDTWAFGRAFYMSLKGKRFVFRAFISAHMVTDEGDETMSIELKIKV